MPIVLLLLIPLTYWMIVARSIIAYPYQAYDPEYAYFLGSLEPFKGGGYTYNQHPGTPLEVIGTLLLGATYPFVAGGSSGFVRYSLNHPELFLGLAHVFLLAGGLACATYLYVTARASRKWRDVLVAISLAWMFYVLHPAAFVTLTYWSHNSFNFPFGTALLVALFGAVQGRRQLRPRVVWLIGIGAGLLASVVVYLAAWIIGAGVTIGALYAFQGLPWKRTASVLIQFVVACAVGFALGILPILRAVPEMFAWFARLALHQGIYGTGAEGITSPEMLAGNLADLFRLEPVPFVVTAIVVASVGLILARRPASLRGNPQMWALALGLLTTILVAFLLVLKHPGVYYLLSVAAALPVLVLTLRELLADLRGMKAVFDGILVAGVWIGLAFQLPNAIHLQQARIANILGADDQISRAMAERASTTGRQVDDLLMVWAYGVFNRCNALVRINDNYMDVFNQELSEACPQQYIMNDTFMSVPRADAPDGSGIDLNATSWDFVVIRESTAAHFVSLLRFPVSTVRLIGVGTGYPGFGMDDPLVMIQRAP